MRNEYEDAGSPKIGALLSLDELIEHAQALVTVIDVDTDREIARDGLSLARRAVANTLRYRLATNEGTRRRARKRNQA